MSIKMVFCLFFVLLFPVNAVAGEYSDVSLGLVLKSFHFTNSFEHKKGFNESNFGPTVYITDRKNIIPLVDEITVSYVHKNSYNSNSIYLFLHHNIFSRKNFKLDISVGAATGYEQHLRIAKNIGFMPLAGVRATFFNHVELGLLPTGIVIKEKGANVLTLSYKF